MWLRGTGIEPPSFSGVSFDYQPPTGRWRASLHKTAPAFRPFVIARPNPRAMDGMDLAAAPASAASGASLRRRITREICEVARGLRIPVLYVMAEVSAAELLATEYPDVNFIIPHRSFGDNRAPSVAL
jgi:hypothetical protein